MHCPQFAPSQNAIPVISCHLLSIVHLMNTYTVSGFFYTIPVYIYQCYTIWRLL